jgi:PTH1 family peptidyl-tRNA hydrolase
MDAGSLIVGLGNPGERYARTRHNAGFMVVDQLAGHLGVPWSLKTRFDALVARTGSEDARVLLAKPQTFMNASGDAVLALTRFYRVPTDRLLVVVDDADLVTGAIRMRPSGSSGGHHGLESIAGRLGSNEFARQRIGIGRAGPRESGITGHVLGRFAEEEWPLMQNVFARAAQQIECWLRSGIEKAMNQYNGIVERSPDQKDSL